MIVLDTNVLSEAMKPLPAAEVLQWLASQPSARLFVTSISQAEILCGLEIMPNGKRRTALQSAAEVLFERVFAGRILPFDADSARLYPGIAASRRNLGRPIAQADAQIAAIARSRGAALATRNTGDFDVCGVTLLNPWQAR